MFAAIGGAAVLLLVLVGFITASLLGSDDAGPGVGADASASASVGASATAPTPSGSAEPTESASPSASPVGPPHELTTGGWARVAVTELNVRTEPGLSSESKYRLVQGAVVLLLEETAEPSDGYLWYRIRSVGGAAGWAASGPEANPFLEMLSDRDQVAHCGEVASGVLTVADGAIQASDVIRVGELALPGEGFTAEVLAGLELIAASDQEACVTIETGAEDIPRLSAGVDYGVCGAVVQEDDTFYWEPSSDSLIEEIRILERAVIDPVVLDRTGAGHPMRTNFEALFEWLSEGDGTGCWFHRSGGLGRIQLDARQCGVIEEMSDDEVVLRHPSGEGTLTLSLSTAGSEADSSLPEGELTGIRAVAVYDDDVHLAALTLEGIELDCG